MNIPLFEGLDHTRLKKMYAEERLKAEILNEALTKNVSSAPV